MVAANIFVATVTYPNLQMYGFEPVLRLFIEDVN